MTTNRTRGAALALTCLMGVALTATAAGAQTRTLTPLASTPVAPSPIHMLPDVDDAAAAAGQGPEQQDAMGAPRAAFEAPASAVTLNAQYAALTQAPGQSFLAPQPVEAVQPTQPADNSPSVAIARRVIDSAGAFEHYMRQASAIHPDFNGGEAVSRALETGATYDQAQLEEGAVAYAALTALQEPAFVETLGELSPDPNARMAVARQLIDHPEAIMQAPGAGRAAARAALVLGRMGADLYTTGASVKHAAYDVQHQAWSHSAILAPQVQLTRIKAQSDTPVAMKAEDTGALMTSLVAMRKSGESPMTPAGPVSPVVARGLALAALAVLGQADEEHGEQIVPLLADAQTTECVKMARLNLYQCLSVAGPQYEDVFCLGQHAMMDTGQCVVKAAGWAALPVPGSPLSVSVPIATPAQRSAPPAVMVPIAFAANNGGQ
ncbi:hypothetical protein [Caulobacter sp. S45]|uniref:hypothetical protein n=1 Tax=Caulobacter sp. S45 TaxID=1641861 RepID=UPI00131D819E|nr:hypothetical protein [Caulobacter sp. S45]